MLKSHQKICIDGIYRMNYKYQLYSEEFATGVPIDYCFLNREDMSLNIFFNSQKTAGKINAVIYLSDDTPSFYNAQKRSMSKAQHGRMACK